MGTEPLQNHQNSFSPRIESRAQSDTGRRRKNNEDSFLAAPELGLYIVCDGMGGHAAGEVASRLAIDTVYNLIHQTSQHHSFNVQTAEERNQLKKFIEYCVQTASHKIYETSQEDHTKRGMGTTITLLLIVGTKAFIGHVGDSRGYLLRNQQTYQLTEDHTMLTELLKAGLELGEDASSYHHALTRALGIQATAKVDVLEIDLLPDDLFILCSDGLHGYIDPTERSLFDLLETVEFTECAEVLVEFANEQGGKDNITVVAVQVSNAPETKGTQQIRSSLDTLQRLQLFKGLDYKEYVALFSLSALVTRHDDQVIITQGQPGDALYIIVEGSVRVERDGIPIARLEAGQHVGEMALFDSSPRSATVRAEGTAAVLRILREDFETFLQQDPASGIKLMRNLLGALAHVVRTQSQALLSYPRPTEEFNEDDFGKTLKMSSFDLSNTSPKTTQQYGDTVELHSFSMLSQTKKD